MNKQLKKEIAILKRRIPEIIAGAKAKGWRVTRGAVGFRVDGVDKVTYNHSDSYPGGLGAAVLRTSTGGPSRVSAGSPRGSSSSTKNRRRHPS